MEELTCAQMVRMYRARNELSQEAFCAQHKLSVPWLRRIEGGERPRLTADAQKLARILEIGETELLAQWREAAS